MTKFDEMPFWIHLSRLSKMIFSLVSHLHSLLHFHAFVCILARHCIILPLFSRPRPKWWLLQAPNWYPYSF